MEGKTVTHVEKYGASIRINGKDWKIDSPELLHLIEGWFFARRTLVRGWSTLTNGEKLARKVDCLSKLAKQFGITDSPGGRKVKGGNVSQPTPAWKVLEQKIAELRRPVEPIQKYHDDGTPKTKLSPGLGLSSIVKKVPVLDRGRTGKGIASESAVQVVNRLQEKLLAMMSDDDSDDDSDNDDTDE